MPSPKSNKSPKVSWYFCSTSKQFGMEYYSAIKKNEIVSFTGKWMELK
jgi:hypothetical protein